MDTARQWPAGVVAREPCVLRYALERHARERPDDIYAVFEDGAVWSFAETLRIARDTAAGLHAAGVRRGDHVVLLLPNGAEALRAMFALNTLGAVFVPVNPALKGALMEHAVNDSGASHAIVHPDVLERILSADLPALGTLIVAGEGAGRKDGRGRAILALDGLDASAGLPELERPIEPWDTQSIIYTSGTTGRSKGVLSSYMHSWSAMSPETWTCTRYGDRHLIHMPVFHIGGAFIACVALCSGSSVAVVERFRTERFWPTVRDMEVTVVFLLGAMATFLLKAPPSPAERDHGLRMVFIVPLGQSGPAFRERFGTEVHTLFNMTEISTPLISGENPRKPNSCGRARPGVELRLVDGNDCEVPEGAVGQLVIRTEQPWAMNHGYNGNPQATAAAWRNGWFHTGDAFMRDADGDYFFVDRLKDVIRRRGENISSYEIEIELLAHPDIREAAAVPVPSEFTEDEVLAVLAPVEGRALDLAEVIAFLEPRMPRHMVPRYLRIVDRLPKTPTEKVEKHVLRSEGVTADTWDRETAKPRGL